MEQRYVVIKGSESGHCCFEFTVVDTQDKPHWVCECFDEEQALIIAMELNRFRPCNTQE